MTRLASIVAFVLASLPVAALAEEPPPELPPAEPAPAPEPRAPVVVTNQDAAPSRAESAEAPPQKRADGAPRNDFVRFGAGLRMGYVDDAAFDTFSKNDALPQLSLEGTTTLLSAGRVSLAAGLAWDVGGRGNGLRGLDASLTVHRFTAPIEGRWHVKPWLYGFARVAPGAALLFTRVDEPSSQAKLKDSSWAFAGDLSAGASILLGPRNDMDRRSPRFWVTPEIGYAFTTSTDLRPKPARNEDDVLGSDAETNLGSIALSGLFWRASLAVTF
jgi:hypothetical protein